MSKNFGEYGFMDLPLDIKCASDEEIFNIATNIVATMTKMQLTISTAESCTGGWIAKAITDIRGSSSVLEGSVVSYSNQCKQRVLRVNESTLVDKGAVSEEVVVEMARGVKQLIDSHFSVAVSGIAGPGGAVSGKPVGTVWIAWQGEQTYTQRFQFSGSREDVRRKTVLCSLMGIQKLLDAGE